MGAEPIFGQRLPTLGTSPPGPKSRALARRLGRVESRNVTYVDDGWPIFWEEASGANVRDADGNVYIDLTSAFGVALLGHSNPMVEAAVKRQLPRLVHGMGDVHPPTAKLEAMERLAVLMPWDETRVVLSSSGSEAVETALKTGQLFSGRPGVIAFSGGYHGLTLGSLSVTERALFRRPFASRTYDGVAFAPFPDARSHGPDAAARSLEVVHALLRSGAPNGDAIGTLIVEPVQARGGARVPPPGFMQELSAMAKAADVVVVADEIMTGLGRCGAVLASGLVGLEPDVVCLGKSLGGGLPLSACAARGEVMDAWPESGGEALHTSTFLGHPLACAVAVDVLRRVASDATPAEARDLGGRLLTAIRQRLAAEPAVADVRGLGLLLGIELVQDGRHPPGGGAAVARAALRRGLITLPAGDEGHVVELTPPLGLTEDQISYSVEALAQSVAEVMGGGR